MTLLHIDIETRSGVDLQKLGVYRYVEDPGFRILLLAFAFDDEPVTVVDLAQGEELPKRFLDGLMDPEIVRCAYNAQFERVCLDRFLHVITPPWFCTMVQANALGLRGSLDAVGRALNLPVDEQKLFTGKNLIRLFSVHRKPTIANGMRTIFEPDDFPKEWEQFKDYCARDVEAERAVHKRLAHFPTHPTERQLYNLDQKINDRGVRIDIDLATAATAINDELYHHYEEEYEQITGIETPKQLARLKAWILETTGETVEQITKGNLPQLQRQFAVFPNVVRALEIREKLSRTSVKKYESMDLLAGADDRARGLFRFYGASTGRWTGRGIQPQNLPQNHLSDLDTARTVIRQRDLGTLELLYDDPADVLSQCIRTAIIPAEERVFVVADFSAIEARVIAWLAMETWRLDVFTTHGKIYEASASQMFGVPLADIHKGHPLRQKGKVAELACGYQGGVGALRQMGALKMGLEEQDLPRLIQQWRQSNSRIVQFWADTEEAIQTCIRTGQPQRINNFLSCRMDRSILFVRLPNGRELAYPKAQLRDHQKFEGKTEITYQEVTPNGWTVKGTYGGKLVENIVQATARDCLAEKMLDFNEYPYPIVMHVHDELVFEVPIESDPDEQLKTVLEVMSRPVAWAPGLPLSADGFTCEYYQKD